jgi:hypothetical protein
MSQILLPPPSQPGQDAPGMPATVEQPAAASEPHRPIYQPEPPKRPSRFWRAVKWPLRQFIKLLYLAGSAARRHRLATALTIGVLLVLGGLSYGVYQYTHPHAGILPGQLGQTGQAATGSAVPFTITLEQAPPLPRSVVNWLHGQQAGNAHEMWTSLSPQAQQGLTQAGVSEATLRQQIDQAKSQGISIEQFVYTGGFSPPDGLASYTIQAILTNQQGQRAYRTEYFVVDPASGQILAPVNLNQLLGLP